jgi:hypothetical protein
MRIFTKFLFVLAALAWSSFSSAAYENGNGLYSNLMDYRSSNTKNVVTASAGVGYVIGVADVMNGRLDPNTDYKFCIPRNASKGQLIDVVVSYLEKSPADRHLAAWSLVQAAFYEAFPCK